jgi:hypothetical protein
MVSHIAITRRLDQMCHIQRQLSANGPPAIALLSTEAAPEVEDGPHISDVVTNLERALKLACS